MPRAGGGRKLILVVLLSRAKEAHKWCKITAPLHQLRQILENQDGQDFALGEIAGKLAPPPPDQDYKVSKILACRNPHQDGQD